MSLCSNHPAFCVFSWSMFCLSWSVVLPWSVYRFYQLWIRSNVQLLWVRRIKFDIIPVIWLNCFVCITLQCYQLKTVAGVSLGSFPIIRLFNTICLLICAVSMIYKVLLSHVDLRFAYVTRELSWKSLIITDTDAQPKLANSKYILWRQTWLSPPYLIPGFTLYIFVGGIILVTLELTGHGSLSGLANVVFIFPLTVILVFTWTYTPSMIDLFGIRTEMKMILAISIFGVGGFLIVTLCFALSGLSETPLDYMVISIVLWISMIMFLYTFTEFRFQLLSKQMRDWDKQTAVSVRRVKEKAMKRAHQMVKKTQSMNKIAEESTERLAVSTVLKPAAHVQEMDLAMASRALSSSVVNQMNGQILNADSDDMIDSVLSPKQLISQRLFAHSDCIAVFADFLSKEISIENLIGFIEFYQLSLSLSAKTDRESQEMLSEFIIKDEVVPLSTINECSDYLQRFILLCDKYVGQQSHYRLNLSYNLGIQIEQLRTDIIAINHDRMSDAERKEQVNIMLILCIKVVKECVSLLTDSFHRFSSHPMFIEFIGVDMS